MKYMTALACSIPFLGMASPSLAGTPAARIGVADRCNATALSTGLPADLHLTEIDLMPRAQAVSPSGSPNGAPVQGNAVVEAHCLLKGAFEERKGAGGKPYALKFEMRVPEAWNGRLLYQGGGGLDGSVQPAMGNNITNGSTAPVALARGFAVVSTDSGHEGADAAFAEDQIAKINFAYAAIGKVTTVARTLAVKVGGKLPDRTYFEGCSNGGREALIAAGRHAELFDGVIAGDPAFHLSAATVLANHAHQMYGRVAPLGTDGKSLLAAALSDTDVTILSKAILADCDGLDGAKDGLIFDHTACHFDPGVIQCKNGQLTGCISAEKVDAIRQAFSGPRNGSGEPLASSYVYDAGVAGDNWRMWQIGLETNGKINSLFPGLVSDTLGGYFHYPAISKNVVEQADPAALLARIAPSAAMTDATSTEFSSFKVKGGKILIVTGWADPIFSPNDLIDWYQHLGKDTQVSGNGEANDFTRLFMIPGMNHCGGGPALDNFDVLTLMVDWVEKGKAPDRFIATGKSFPGVSRPICAYPRHATYQGSGSRDEAASFTCS